MPLPAPRARFRRGPLRVCPDFLAVVSGDPLVRSMVRRFTGQAVAEAGRLVSRHG